jgi:hypothetical protein
LKYNKLLPAAGSVILTLFLFIYGLINNMPLSYMGNTNRQFEEYILNNFPGDIILFLLKIFFVYIITGLILGAVAQLFILVSGKIINRAVSFEKL